LIGQNGDLAIGAPGHRVASGQDYAECCRVMRAATRNYSSASALLPRRKRKHVEALYALMRVGDDRVDISSHGFASPLEAIEDWERAYWDAFRTGASPRPVMRAYLNTALTFGIPGETMSPYFRAMKDDLVVTRYPTFKDLLHYMKGSAIPVGRAMIRILGVRPGSSLDDTLPYADCLSVAMQMSNFWRDIGHDYDIGRIYIPLEDMDRFGVSKEDLAAGRISPAFMDLMEFEIGRTEDCYATARVGVRLLASGRWGVMSALNIYRAILPSIRRNGYDVFSRRAGTTAAQRAGLSLKAAWGLCPGGLRRDRGARAGHLASACCRGLEHLGHSAIVENDRGS
jgi:phytoene synthase